MIIAEYSAEYKLRDWIPKDKLNYALLYDNIHDGALELLKANSEKIEWYILSRNPNIFSLNTDKILISIS